MKVADMAGWVTLALLAAAMPSPAWAQASPGQATAPARAPRSASGAYEAKDWPLCAQRYGIQADRVPPVRDAAYGAACCLAMAGDVEGAFARLQKIPSDQLPSHFADDSDLVSLHGDPRWIALSARHRADTQAQTARLDTALLDELRQRVDRDQAVRDRIIQDPQDAAAHEELVAVDRDNTAWLKAYLAAHGWPSHAKVGRGGSQAFWLLAQHADADPQFQAQVLDLMGAAVARGEASGAHLAYLTDRVRLAQGKPQLYGTQFENSEGLWRPRTLEDPEHVDARRAALGMDSLAEYTATMEDVYAGRP